MAEFSAIDKCQYATHIQIGFRSYNSSEPAKYSPLFKCVNDVRYPFTHRSDPSAEKPKQLGGVDNMSPT